MEKKGVSPVVATVLLIIIVLVMIAVLAFLLMPTIREKLKERSECVQLVNSLNFYQSSYLCYYDDEDNDKDRTSIPIQISNTGIGGFRLALFAEGKSNTIDVEQGTKNDILKMLNGEFGQELEVLNDGSVRTYVAKGLFKKLSISAILSNGYRCTSTQKSIDLKACVDRSVLNGTTNEPVCGNSIKEGSEQCDGNNFGSYGQAPVSCSSYSSSYTTGTLSCNDPETANECRINTDGCGGPAVPICGDNIIQSPEQCEGTNFNGQTCASVLGAGYTGNLACFAPGTITPGQCIFNTGGCVPPANQLCTLNNLRWDKTSAYEGDQVKLYVDATSCQGKTIEFKVWEDDLLFGDDPVNINPPNSAPITLASQTIDVIWTSEWQDDAENPPEYYFRAKPVGNPGWKTSSTAEELELKVYKCGDNILTNPPETCEGNNFGSYGTGVISCNSYNPLYTSGNLQCNSCNINFDDCGSQTPPVCGDEIVNGNEQCEPNIPPLTNQCSVSGQSGTQICNANCMWGSCTVSGPQCGNNQCEIGEPGSSGSCCTDCLGSCPGTGICGDGHLDSPPEECDDGDTEGGDGCSATCVIEDQWTCWHTPSSLSLCCPKPGSGLPAPQFCPGGGGTLGGPFGQNWNIWMGWGDPNPSCGGAGPFSCASVFQSLGGIAVSGEELLCSTEPQTCSGVILCGPAPSNVCPLGYQGEVSWWGMGVCCKIQGTIDVKFITCRGTCAGT